jgi:hypothetical protein
MSITRPWPSTMAPPEFPGEIGASVCIRWIRAGDSRAEPGMER